MAMARPASSPRRRDDVAETSGRGRRRIHPRRGRGAVYLTSWAAVLSLATAAAAFGGSRAADNHRCWGARRTASSAWSVRASSLSSADTHLGAVELKHAEYTAAGPPAALGLHDPVVILHGLLGSKRNFASLASSLSVQLGKPRRILAVDLRNHGDNAHDWRDDMSYPSMARDVLAVMDREGIRRAVLVGHSVGGKVAASLSLLEPDRVGGLVVLDIAPVRYCPRRDASWGAVQASIDAIAGVELNNGVCTCKRDVDVALRPALEDPALRAFVLTNLHQERPPRGQSGPAELRWKINVDAICRQLDVLAGFDLHPGRIDVADDDRHPSNLPSDDDDLPDHQPRSRRAVGVPLSLSSGKDTAPGSGGGNNLPPDDDDQPRPSDAPPRGDPAANNNEGENGGRELRYHGDVFIISGGSSQFVRQAHLPVIREYFPNYMVTTVRGAGHWVHAEAPDDTLALLKRYLDR